MTISNPHVKNVRLAATSLCAALALALTTPYPVSAQDTASREHCAILAALAETIMQARQVGAALGDALAAADGNVLLEAVVMDAWSMPRMSMPENQRREIEEFRDAWHLTCLQSL